MNLTTQNRAPSTGLSGPHNLPATSKVSGLSSPGSARGDSRSGHDLLSLAPPPSLTTFGQHGCKRQSTSPPSYSPAPKQRSETAATPPHSTPSDLEVDDDELDLLHQLMGLSSPTVSPPTSPLRPPPRVKTPPLQEDDRPWHTIRSRRRSTPQQQDASTSLRSSPPTAAALAGASGDLGTPPTATLIQYATTAGPALTSTSATTGPDAPTTPGSHPTVPTIASAPPGTSGTNIPGALPALGPLHTAPPATFAPPDASGSVPGIRHTSAPAATATDATTASAGAGAAAEGSRQPQHAGAVLLVDPLSQWLDQEVALLLAIRDLDSGVVVRSLRPVPCGFRIAVTDVPAFSAAVAVSPTFTTCSTELPTRPPPALEVTLTIPVTIPCERILADLQERLGEDVRNVRRLHATTAGKVDRSRPINRVVVAVRGEETASRVRTCRLFGVLAPSASTARPVAQATQCLRCFKFGHRPAACRQERRCIRCGSTQHVASACSLPREATTCLNCRGSHAVTWAGCPHRLRAAREQDRARGRPAPRQTLTTAPPPPTPYRPLPLVQESTTRPSFASMAAPKPAAPAVPSSDSMDVDPDGPPRTKEATQQPEDPQIRRQRLEDAISQADRDRTKATDALHLLGTKEARQAFLRVNRRCHSLRKRLDRLLSPPETAAPPTQPTSQLQPSSQSQLPSQPQTSGRGGKRQRARQRRQAALELQRQQAAQQQQLSTQPPPAEPSLPATSQEQPSLTRSTTPRTPSAQPSARAPAPLDVVVLLQQMRALVQVATSREAALLALDAVLAALPPHLLFVTPPNV